MKLKKEDFNQLKDFYDENDFEKLTSHKLGIYFLKLRSLSRAPILRELAAQQGINISGIDGRALFKHIFLHNIPEKKIDAFIKNLYKKERKKRLKNESQLYTQLYKLKVFNWGGFYQNAVEQTIVNNYVKKITDYELLHKLIATDINPRFTGYILCSWYNHWTSILIEDMFEDHPQVLPTVGLVKKVDFFWHNFPFDLKVTYFPDGFLQLKRRALGLRPELSELKAFARENNIRFDTGAKDKEIFSELLLKISEDTSLSAKKFIKNLHRMRKEIILKTIKRPKELIKWLYEEQGVRRFDAANRFFLILINLNNLEGSWKLKRNKKLLNSEINRFLKNNKSINTSKLKIQFNWQGKVYATYSTALFIVVD